MTEEKQIEVVRIVRPTDEERKRILEIIESSFKNAQMNKFIFGDDLATQRLFHLRKLGGAFDPDPSVHQDKEVEGYLVNPGGIREYCTSLCFMRGIQVDLGGCRPDKMEYERRALEALPEERREWIKNERKALSKRAEQSVQFEIKQAFNLEIIATHPSARRHGLGTMLVRKLISLLTKKEPHVWLTSTHDTAVQFYEKLGFNVVFEDVIHFGEEEGKFRGIAYEFTSE